MEEQDFSFPGRMKLESPDQEFVRQFLYVFADAGFIIPHDIIVINLAPAELPNQAPSFDLTIPIGIGSIFNQLDSNRFSQYSAVVESLEIIPVHTLQEAVGFLNGQLDIDPVPSRLDELFAAFSQYDIDFSDVRGQDMAKRAL